MRKKNIQNHLGDFNLPTYLSSFHSTEFVRGVNCNSSGGNVTVNVSNASCSNASPVSPGANPTSKYRTIMESEIRRLSMARLLPGQPYGPRRLGQSGCMYIVRRSGGLHPWKTAERAHRLLPIRGTSRQSARGERIRRVASNGCRVG